MNLDELVKLAHSDLTKINSGDQILDRFKKITEEFEQVKLTHTERLKDNLRNEILAISKEKEEFILEENENELIIKIGESGIKLRFVLGLNSNVSYGTSSMFTLTRASKTDTQHIGIIPAQKSPNSEIFLSHEIRRDIGNNKVSAESLQTIERYNDYLKAEIEYIKDLDKFLFFLARPGSHPHFTSENFKQVLDRAISEARRLF